MAGSTIARTMVRDWHEIPEFVFKNPYSPAFVKFVRSYFGDTRAVTHYELDLTFLREMTPEETILAKELLRRNLALKHNHIIEGLAAPTIPMRSPGCAGCYLRSRTSVDS
jgi:hypothetical protein